MRTITVLLLLVLCSTFFGNHLRVLADDDNQDQRNDHHGNNKREHNCNCTNVINICPDFNPQTGYIISTSGVYELKCNVIFYPAANGVSAITILANVTNVDLDFDDHTLIMSDSSTTADNFGILIQSGAKNIAIYDGTIEGFSASQIKALDSVNTIDIQDMILTGRTTGSRLLTETTTNGIYVAGLANLPAQNIKVANVIIRNIIWKNSTVSDILVRGIFMINANNIEIDHVRVASLQNTGPVTTSTGATIPFNFDTVNNIVVRSCRADNNTAIPFNDPFAGPVTGDVLSLRFRRCSQVEAYDCSFLNNFGTRRTGGILWIDGTHNFIAERCQAQNNTIRNTQALGTQSHFGFEAVAVNGQLPVFSGVIKDCHVTNQPTAFVANTGSNDIIFQECTAIAGNLVSNPGTSAEGFRATGGANGITFQDCVATGFMTANPIPPSNISGSGFQILSAGTTNINIIRCKSTKNSQGIFVQAGVTNVVADSNELAFNTYIGFQDSTPGQTHNLYIRNIAYANGKVAGSQYSVNTANPNFVVFQLNQAAQFPNEATTANISPLSNYDLSP